MIYGLIITPLVVLVTSIRLDYHNLKVIATLGVYGLVDHHWYPISNMLLLIISLHHIWYNFVLVRYWLCNHNDGLIIDVPCITAKPGMNTFIPQKSTIQWVNKNMRILAVKSYGEYWSSYNGSFISISFCYKEHKEDITRPTMTSASTDFIYAITYL